MNLTTKKLRFAVIAVDIVVFSFINGKLCVLVSIVNRPPHYVNLLGFPGGLINPNENAEEACERILQEKVDVNKAPLEQLHTFSDVGRDKRNRVISVAYMGFVRPDIAIKYSNNKANFIAVNEISSLAYDHKDILLVALKRLQGKLAYTTIAQYMLSKEFTLSELQTVYETILNRKFDKRNFRKKILTLDIIKETGKMQEGVKNRPAALFKFNSTKDRELPFNVF